MSRLRFPNHNLVGSRGGGLSVVSSSVLDDAVWAIDARSGAVDRAGTAPPIPMANSLLGANGLVSVSGYTNEADPGASLWSTPHSADMVPTTSVSMRAHWGGIGDPSAGGLITQSVGLRKALSSDPLIPVLDLCVTEDGQLRFAVRDDTDTYRGVDAGSGLDWLEANTVRCDYNFTTGAYAMFTSADDGATWTPLASGTLGPYTLVSDTGPLDFQVGKSVGWWCELWVDGALAVKFDVEDCDEGDTTVVSSSTGETWTAGDGLSVFDMDRAGWVVVSAGANGFGVADAPALDIGTGDFTAAIVYEAGSLASGGADFRGLLAKFNPATIGTNGVGWGFVDYSPLGGVGFALNDGGGLKFAFASWPGTFDRVLLVATGDRDGNLRLFIDDMVTAAATTDISDTTDTLTNALDVFASTPAPALLSAAALWDRVLTAGELSSLPTLMGV